MDKKFAPNANNIRVLRMGNVIVAVRQTDEGSVDVSVSPVQGETGSVLSTTFAASWMKTFDAADFPYANPAPLEDK